MMKTFCVAVTALVLCGCVSSKLSTIPSASSPVAIHVIALAPGDGLIEDAVGGEMANRGFQIVDPGSTSRIIGRVNLNEFEVTRPESISKLREQGVDAVLIVKAAGGYDQQPQSATGRIVSTTTGQVISAVSWQNGWGGQRNSIADRQMRSGLMEAAAEIATGMSANIRQDPNARMPDLSQTPSSPSRVTAAGPASASGKFGYAAEVFAKGQRCVAAEAPRLIATGPGFESFSVACSVGEPMLIRCEFGNCRALQ